MKTRILRLSAYVAPVLAMAGPACAEDLINYSTISTGLTTQVGTAITAAVAIGVLILGARMGWKFFKGFTK